MITDLFPKIAPSLDLNFARAQKLDSRITFSRPSAATYFDRNGILRTAASGVPRFDFDPITGACKGLLIEEQRTNLLIYSEQFDNAAWGKGNATVIPNAAVAPDGTLTADKLVEDTANSTHAVYVSQTYTATAHALSCFVKKDQRSSILLAIWDGTTTYGRTINILTGDSVVFGSAPASFGVQAQGNGWYRVWITASTLAAVGTATISLANSSNNATYAGDGTSGIFIWGAQLEAGSFPTSYIKTEAAQATRAADVALMTGSNFSSWYRQDEGSFVCSGNSANVGTASSAAVAAFKDSNNYQRIRVGGTYSDITAVSGGVAQVDTTGIAFAQGKAVTTAMAYKLNDYAQSSNGGVVETDTSATLPVGIDTLNIGATTSGFDVLNGHISRLAYYPKRLTNTELQALTS